MHYATPTTRPFLFATVATLAIGCKAPPEAPERFEELCDYIFAHTDDEEPEAVVAGLDNLTRWMEKPGNLESTSEGYTISKLSQESVSDLQFDTDRAPDVSSLIGAAVAIRHGATLKRMAQTTVVDNWENVAEGQYEEYRRNFGNQSPGCFPSKTCEELTATSFSKSSWAGLIDVDSKNKIDFRWFFSEESNQWFLVHRSWLTEPATVDPDRFGIDVQAQYFLAVTTKVKGKTVRTMATWIDADYGSIPLGEDGVKSQIVASMVKQGDFVDKWHEN